MSTSSFPDRWPVKHPELIQLYSLATPNGKKVGVALEELELPYEAHLVNIMKGDQFDTGYVSINPNSKIPTLIDPNGPDDKPITLMESGAILLYLAEKTGKLMQAEYRWETIQWVFFQMAGIGPMFGQFGHFFKFAQDKTTDDYGVQRYQKEVERLLGVLNTRLGGRQWLVGDQYSIADIAIFPWIDGLDFYEAKDTVNYSSFADIEPWVQRCKQSPATQRGLKVCA